MSEFVEKLCARMTIETAQLVVARATEIQQELRLSPQQRDYIARVTGGLVSDVVSKTAGLFKEVEQEWNRQNP